MPATCALGVPIYKPVPVGSDVAAFAFSVNDIEALVVSACIKKPWPLAMIFVALPVPVPVDDDEVI